MSGLRGILLPAGIDESTPSGYGTLSICYVLTKGGLRRRYAVMPGSAGDP